MSCIDCHTGAGLMGFLRNDEGSGIDIRCDDCHANRNPRLTLASEDLGKSRDARKIPFPLTGMQPFLATINGTPLWHVQLQGQEAYLYPKTGGPAIRIPQVPVAHVPLQEKHKRLTCDACHAEWVPTCLGCHVEYDPEASQWDHLEGKATAGAWKEVRWDIDAAPPTLGLTGDGKIQVFVPGMIMTLAHPELGEPLFLRHFAELSPHTTGKSRGCNDCHRSSVSLGLGKGTLSLEGDALKFSPSRHLLQDGLPADAWASLLKDRQATAKGYPRPFNAEEIKRIFTAVPDP